MRKILIIVLGLLLTLLGCSITENIGDYYDSEENIKKKTGVSQYEGFGEERYSNGYECVFEVFTGKKEIVNITTEEAVDVKFDYNSEIESGRFKLVLVDEDKEITNIFEGSDKGEVTITLPKGDSNLYLLGDEGKGRVKFGIEPNDSMDIYVLSITG